MVPSSFWGASIVASLGNGLKISIDRYGTRAEPYYRGQLWQHQTKLLSSPETNSPWSAYSTLRQAIKKRGAAFVRAVHSITG